MSATLVNLVNFSVPFLTILTLVLGWMNLVLPVPVMLELVVNPKPSLLRIQYYLMLLLSRNSYNRCRGSERKKEGEWKCLR